MDALWIMLKNVLIFVGLALPGYILVKAKFIKTMPVESIFFFPCKGKTGVFHMVSHEIHTTTI